MADQRIEDVLFILRPVWEDEGLTYEQWLEKQILWAVEERDRDDRALAEELSARWDGTDEHFCRWFIRRCLWQWDAFLERSASGKRGRPTALKLGGLIALRIIPSLRAWRCGYGPIGTIWTTERIRDAVRRYDGSGVSAKTIRRMLKSRFGYIWTQERGWELPNASDRFSVATPMDHVHHPGGRRGPHLEEYEARLVARKIGKTLPDPMLVKAIDVEEVLEEEVNDEE